MKQVMVFGTFDIFHPGHEYFLKQARKLGDYLIVVIARDKTVIEIKNKKPLHNERQRLKLIEQSRLANRVILGSITDKYLAIKKYRPRIIALGYDQANFVIGLEDKLKSLNLLKTKIIRLKPFKPNKYKSSILKHAK